MSVVGFRYHWPKIKFRNQKHSWHQGSWSWFRCWSQVGLRMVVAWLVWVTRRGLGLDWVVSWFVPDHRGSGTRQRCSHWNPLGEMGHRSVTNRVLDRRPRLHCVSQYIIVYIIYTFANFNRVLNQVYNQTRKCNFWESALSNALSKIK